MNESKIRKFGLVTETKDGRLHVTGFEFERGENSKDTPYEIELLALIKERIEQEIKLYGYPERQECF